MKTEMTFEDWMNFYLVVGEVVEVNGSEIKIDIGDKILETNKNIIVEKGEKIVVGIDKDNLIIPLVDNSIIVPEKEIENGSRIG